MSLSTRTKVKPPGNLSVTYSASGGFAANITWTPIESGKPIDYYVIYRDGDELASGLLSASYRDSSVVEGRDYYYSVATVNVSETESAPSPSELLEVPAYPVWDSGISLTIVHGQTASIASKCTDPRGLSLTFTRSGGTAPSGATINSAGLISVSASTAAGVYTLLSDASNGILSSTSGSISLTVQAAAVAPDVPINFVAQAISSTRIDLTWSAAVTGVAPDDYDLDYSTVGSSGPWTSMPFSGTATTKSHTGLSAGTDYYYRLRANKSGLSSAYVSSSERTQPANGTNWIISSGASSYDASLVQPGDTITISRGSGTRGPLTITGISGSAVSPITVRSDPAGQTLIRAPAGMSGGFVLTFIGCEYFEVDGSQTPGSTYGIKVAPPTSGSAAPSAWIQFKGGSQHYSMHHVDVDGGWPGNATFGVGIQANDHALSKGNGRYIDGIEIHDCRVRYTNRTAFYIGPNYVLGDLPLKNVLIHDNIVSDVGGTGVCLKNVWSGTNKIYGNTITNAGGLFVDADQRCGITFTSSTGEIYGNTVINAGMGNSTAVGASSGIRCYTNDGPSATVAEPSYGTFATFEIRAYNNLVIGSASAGLSSQRDAGTTVPVPYFYNNTVVNSGTTGILTASTSGGFIRNNIALGNATQISGSATATNNLISGTTIAATFVDPGNNDYHLLSEVAAVGFVGTDISSTDIEGTSRAGTASKGAYEYA